MNDYNQNNQNPYNYEYSQPQTPPVYDYTQQPVPEQNVRKEPSRKQAIKAFVFGIVAVECCSAPLISIVAIIFGALAKKNGSKILLEAPTGATRVFAILGKVFGLIGFIVGIVMTVITPFYIISLISNLIDALEFSLFI